MQQPRLFIMPLVFPLKTWSVLLKTWILLDTMLAPRGFHFLNLNRSLLGGETLLPGQTLSGIHPQITLKGKPTVETRSHTLALLNAFSVPTSQPTVPTVPTTAENAAFADFVGRGEKKQFLLKSVLTSKVSNSRKLDGCSCVAFAKVATPSFAKFLWPYTKG